MALTKAFYDAVNSNDVRMVRIMMKDSLLIDLTFNQFDEMGKVARNMENLYDEHDGRELNMDQATWNDEYMNKLKVQVVHNFSHKRLEHLKDVIRYLRPIASKQPNVSQSEEKQISPEKQNPCRPKTSYKEQKEMDQRAGNCREVQIASGAIAGAAIGGVVAASTSVTVIGCAVAGALVGGTLAAIITGGEK